ncbi:hypothetical protein MHBO_003839 [Bonamia ostreae]|uniref:Phosphatidylinositol N-acetylglucosaminyltransferase subunit H conserved domain-containing protein n=1 Tax=Bonamia ostreae TaxID=126728 RepID=A0ABV2ASA6_9EUKA
MDSNKQFYKLRGLELQIKTFSDEFSSIELIDKKKIFNNFDLFAFLFFVLASMYVYLYVEKLSSVVIVLFLCSLPASFVVIDKRNYTLKEEMLILENHGLQINRYKRKNEPFKSVFISWDQIEDVLINEGINFYKYFYYVAIVVREKDGSKSVVIPFETFNAKIEILMEIWKDLRCKIGLS